MTGPQSLLVFGLALAEIGCGAGTPVAPSSDTLRYVPAVRLTNTLYGDFNSRQNASQRLVVRDQQTWNEVWQLTGPQTLGPATNWKPVLDPLPAVDFTREILIVASYGFTDQINRIRVEAAAVSSAGLTVWVRRVTQRCYGLDALGNPTDIVRIQRIDSSVHFVDVEDPGVCK